MKVGELIKRLNKCDKSADVVIEHGDEYFRIIALATTKLESGKGVLLCW
jgi:hypothetical protein